MIDLDDELARMECLLERRERWALGVTCNEMIELITRLRQAEKDAARYRSANERAESLISYIDCEVSELVKNDYSRYCELDGIATETGHYLRAMKCEP